MTKTAKIAIAKITVTRAEGLTAECGKPVTLKSIEGANRLLHAWSDTAPKTGGYDKCDFRIEFEDGTEYKGRYDLKHHSQERADVGEHVRSNALFYTGRWTPSHMTPEKHKAFLQLDHIKDAREAYESLIAKYDIGFIGHPPEPQF